LGRQQAGANARNIQRKKEAGENPQRGRGKASGIKKDDLEQDKTAGKNVRLNGETKYQAGPSQEAKEKKSLNRIRGFGPKSSMQEEWRRPKTERGIVAGPGEKEAE